MNKDNLKWFIFGSIISAENDEFTEEIKQAIIARYDKNSVKQDWKYVLEPIEDIQVRDRLIQLFEDEKD